MPVACAPNVGPPKAVVNTGWMNACGNVRQRAGVALKQLAVGGSRSRLAVGQGLVALRVEARQRAFPVAATAQFSRQINQPETRLRLIGSGRRPQLPGFPPRHGFSTESTAKLPNANCHGQLSTAPYCTSTTIDRGPTVYWVRKTCRSWPGSQMSFGEL